MPAFDHDAPVLVPDRVEYAGKRTWLLWPALQYRVATPLVHDPALNVFQRAMLGFARAGRRALDDIADLMGLEIEFAELVRDDLRTLGYLDEFGVVTPAGIAALADGFVDPRQTVVTHIYQDPFTGTLWPASVRSPFLVGARWRARDRAELDLGTAGRPVPVSPLAIPVDGMPEAPASDEIVEAVSRGEENARRGKPGREWIRRPPERVAARVSMMAAGQPVYLPVVLATTGAGGSESTTWLAFSPFSGQSSPFLRQLVATRSERHPPLQRVVEKLAGRPADEKIADYARLGTELHAQYRSILEQRFTHALRDHRELLELLTLMEHNRTLAQLPGRRATEQSTAANIGWRIQEMVLRAIVRRHRSRPVKAPGKSTWQYWQRLSLACERIGLDRSQYRAVSVVTRDRDLERVFARPHTAKTPELLAAALISAVRGGPDHPVRRLAGHRPTLLTDLTYTSGDRNDASHEALVEIDREFVDLSRRLAYESVAAYLDVPVPDHD